MEKLTAEAIVAGSRELDRRKEVLHRLMMILLNEILTEYLSSFERSDTYHIGTIVEDQLSLELMIIREQRQLQILQVGMMGPKIIGIWGKSLSSISGQTTHLLWKYKEQMVEMTTSRFPKIRERLEFFASCAPQ